jgi:hypothetical protein
MFTPGFQKQINLYRTSVQCCGSLSCSISSRFHGGFSSLCGHKAYGDNDDSLLCFILVVVQDDHLENSRKVPLDRHDIIIDKVSPPFHCSFSNAISHIFLLKVNRCLNFTHCYRAGAEEPKLNCLLEPEPKITNCGSGSSSGFGSFLFITNLKKFCRKKSWSLKKFW